MAEDKKKKTKALAVAPKKNIATVNAETLIAQAIAQGTPVETMERILLMRKELKAEFAKEEYDKAMSALQGELPIIKKTKSVETKAGKKAYSFAPLDNIVKQTKDPIKKHGFSYAIQTYMMKDDKGLVSSVKSVCIVKHIAGHSEPYEMEVPLGNKTDIMSQSQVVAAASTFSKRYAFCNAFGIMTSDDDEEEILIEGEEAEKKEKFVNYIDLLKAALAKKGAKSWISGGVDMYNKLTGESLTDKNFPKDNKEARRMYDALVNSPAFNE